MLTISYLPMVNAWSLAWEALNGTMEETYPIIDTNVGAGNTALDKVRDDITGDGLDYEDNYYDDYLADVDEQRAHHFRTYDDGMSLQVTEDLEMAKTDHNFKYHEDEILKDIQEYVSRTYQGHYTGTKHQFRKVQTIDLMAVSYTHLTLPTIYSV